MGLYMYVGSTTQIILQARLKRGVELGMLQRCYMIMCVVAFEVTM